MESSILTRFPTNKIVKRSSYWNTSQQLKSKVLLMSLRYTICISISRKNVLLNESSAWMWSWKIRKWCSKWEDRRTGFADGHLVWSGDRSVNPLSFGCIMEKMANCDIIFFIVHALGVSMVQLHNLLNSYFKVLWCLTKYDDMGMSFESNLMIFHHWQTRWIYKNWKCFQNSNS